MNVKFAITMFVILLVGGAWYGGYYMGNEQSQSSAYSAGYTKAKNDTPTIDWSLLVTKSEYETLRTDYNNLVANYNSLANAPRYQARQPVSCTSNTYGSIFPTTYTNCY